ncbi:MAG TPA: riboflavin kinase [Ktedonobacterales bacterium]|nr:riboflavin kinase [Ktedonobacterales bacterium]
MAHVYYLLDQPDHPQEEGRPHAAIAGDMAQRPPWLAGPVALVVSDFDGAHAEQRRLVARGAAVAAALGARAVGLTFWPQPGLPGDFTGPQAGAGRLLTTLDERLELLADLRAADGAPLLAGVVVVANSDALAQRLHAPEAALAQLSAWWDVRALLGLADEAATTLDVAALAAVAAQRGIAVESLAAPDADPTAGHADGETVGAPFGARIRALIEAGEMGAATQRLGYPYRVQGLVGAGDQRGRLLGFPTANLQPDPRKALPANGIYAVRVRLPGERAFTHAGAANVGIRPTFTAEDATARRLVEVYLLDATLDLYGLTIGVEFVARLRPEQRFSGPHALEELKQQMARDIQQTRVVLART